MNSDINSILTVYLGTDSKGGYRPVGHEKRMKSEYKSNAENRLSDIKKYLDFNFTPNWSKCDLNQAGDAFAAAAKEEFPELEDFVTKALGNRFTYAHR
ncbi:MAG: hypothetical protein NE328_00375 [Lentisphaeraceae bacterium]|nr:hypothetical protein [Lentisphaeraceae bacterium]